MGRNDVFYRESQDWSTGTEICLTIKSKLYELGEKKPASNIYIYMRSSFWPQTNHQLCVLQVVDIA